MKKTYKILGAITKSFSTPVFSFILSLIGIKLYGKSSWGEFIYTFTWILLLAFFTNFGNKEYLIRKYSNDTSNITLHFSKSFLSRSLLLFTSLILLLFLPISTAIPSIILIALIFIYQSFDSLIIYYQKFTKQLIVEIIGFSIICIGFIGFKDFNLSQLIYLFCFSFLIKVSILFGTFKSHFRMQISLVSLNEIKKLWPFFLIGFSGFLASKIDLYVVNITMSKTSISEYQIGISAFILLQSVSYLLILPFNKHLYRLSAATIKNITQKLNYLAFPIVLTGTICIWLILEKITHLQLPNQFYILGGLSALPSYFYIIDVMQLYKKNKEYLILKISFIAVFINMTLSCLLIYNFGIIGGVTSVLIMQIIVLLLYKKWKH